MAALEFLNMVTGHISEALRGVLAKERALTRLFCQQTLIPSPI